MNVACICVVCIYICMHVPCVYTRMCKFTLELCLITLTVCRLTSVFISLSESVWFSFEGGAPNYYPNSFSAPQEQRYAIEHRSRCSPDVQRFNSANEDNVTQVMTSSSARRVPRSVSLLVSAYVSPPEVSDIA